VTFSLLLKWEDFYYHDSFYLLEAEYICQFAFTLKAVTVAVPPPAARL
jgi:hypothetical protein